MALRRIALRDFVIVRALELDLSGGFTVLTGETGAGKSILIDALQLALGNRADAGAVREGAERLDVERRIRRRPGPGHLARRRRLRSRRRPAAAPHRRPAGPQPRLDQRQPGHGHAVARARRPPARHPRPARLAKPDAARGACAACSTPTPACAPMRSTAAWQGWRQALAALDTRALGAGLAAARARAPAVADRRGRQAGAGRRRVGRAVDQPLAHLQRAGPDRRRPGRQPGTGRRRQRRPRRACAARSRCCRTASTSSPSSSALGEVLASSVAQASDAAHSLHGYLRQADTDPQTAGRAGRAHGPVDVARAPLQAPARRTAGAARGLAGRAAGARCAKRSRTRWSAPSKTRSRPT